MPEVPTGLALLAHLTRPFLTLGLCRFAVYERPEAEPVAIEPAPRLESWMGRDHPDQVRLREYLDWLEPRVAPLLLPERNALELVIAVCRMRTNARMISTFTATARGLRRTLESIATPSSVNARGSERRRPPLPPFEITIRDFKVLLSLTVSRKAKSSGNRARLRSTAWLRALVVTP